MKKIIEYIQKQIKENILFKAIAILGILIVLNAITKIFN